MVKKKAAKIEYSNDAYKENKIIRRIDLLIYSEVNVNSIVAQYPASEVTSLGLNYPMLQYPLMATKGFASQEFNLNDCLFMMMYKVTSFNNERNTVELCKVGIETGDGFEGYNINQPLNNLFVNDHNSMTVNRVQFVRQKNWWLITER